MKERFPLVTYLLLSGAMCWSGAALFQVSPFSTPIQTGLSMVGLLLFFFELRLMDEWKDYEKDKLAHPTRPLPRGLISPAEVRIGISVGMALMMAFTSLLGFLNYSDAAGMYGGITVYLWLMYKEFFVAEKLSSMPFLYGFTHQVILLPLMAFPVAIFHSKGWLQSSSLELGLTVLGAFFTYELCRKLDPQAHPVLKTYPQVYGRGGTFFRITLTTATAMLGSSLLHIESVSVPPLMITWLASLIWMFRPTIHKGVEALATLSLLAHLACIPLAHWIHKL
jgi:4-hydroxybenzoate polyprenyltransferase